MSEAELPLEACGSRASPHRLTDDEADPGMLVCLRCGYRAPRAEWEREPAS